MFVKPRQLGLVVVIALLVSSLGVGTVWSYVRTARWWWAESVKDLVPIEFELKRLELAIRDLLPEIQADREVAAQLDVEIEYQQRQIQAIRRSQQEAKTQMQKLRDALVGERKSYEFGGQTYSRREVEQDLKRRLQGYDSAAVALAAKEQILQARQRTLEAATERIWQYQQQHDQLVQKTESLKAELKLVEMAQQAGDFQLDPSKLGAAKQLAQDVEKRIRTIEKLLDGRRQAAGGIPVDAEEEELCPVQDFDKRFAGK